MTHWLHYHVWDGVEERRRKYSNMPFDLCSRGLPWPSKMAIGDTIWGFTKNENRYFILGSLTVTWFGEIEDLPGYITSESIFNYKQFAAGCPTNQANAYRAVEMEELELAELPHYNGGVELRTLTNIQLNGLFQELDATFVEEMLI